MRRILVVLLVVAVAGVASANVVGKDGTTVPNKPASVPFTPRVLQADFEWNSGGVWNTVPTLGGSYVGWGSHFIVQTTNTLAEPIVLTELGFPNCGPGPAAWMVWVGTAQPGIPASADYSGPFTPVDPEPDTFPPVVYTYIDVSGEGIVIPAGSDFWFGYQLSDPGIGGQVSFNDVVTYTWYLGAWDADQGWGRTAVLQVAGNMVAQQATVTVEVGPGGGGTVSGGGVYDVGEMATVTANPDSGWQFLHWLVNDTEITDNPYTFEVTEDITLVAVFQQTEAIPTMGIVGVVLLLALLAGVGVFVLRRM